MLLPETQRHDDPGACHWLSLAGAKTGKDVGNCHIFMNLPLNLPSDSNHVDVRKLEKYLEKYLWHKLQNG